jgi:anti-anti-sigma regulatory factor
MDIQNLSKDVLLVTLSQEPHLSGEIIAINEAACADRGHHFIIDFSKTKIVTSESINSLIIMERQLADLGYKLILCAVPAQLKRVFWRTGLESLFQFAPDELTALQFIRHSLYLYG